MLLSEAMQAYVNVVNIGTPCHGRFATKMLRKVVGTNSSGSFVVTDTFLHMYRFMVAQEWDHGANFRSFLRCFKILVSLATFLTLCQDQDHLTNFQKSGPSTLRRICYFICGLSADEFFGIRTPQIRCFIGFRRTVFYYFMTDCCN